MSIKIKDIEKAVPSGVFSYGYGYVVSEGISNNIVGKVLTLIETLGLSDKQEEAVKGLVKQAIYDSFYEDAVFISGDIHSAVRKGYWEKKRKSIDIPMSAISFEDIN